MRKADVKIGKVNDHANGSTAEILREINTVRQFGMEAEEARRYGIIARWREQLQFSMKSVQRISWFSMWMAWYVTLVSFLILIISHSHLCFLFVQTCLTLDRSLSDCCIYMPGA